MNEEKKINVVDDNMNEVENEENVTEQAQETTAEQSEVSEEDAAEDCAENSSQEEPSPLEKAEEEIKVLTDKFLRTAAEFENYRKRTLKEKAELILNGSEKTITAILPVLDDFERALADNTDDAKAIKEGMELIFHKFAKVLEGLGVKKIETEDKDFDVDFHEAIAMVPGMGDDKKGKVIDCVQTGYTLNDKVIRHAKVAVGQ
ncbi:MAG: nucleotide exchange factor GrpE [Prevotella sp.]|nr:nucleotide exchange factor GrpE [Prevotella sp.]